MASVLDGKTLVALGDSLIHGSKLGPSATWVNKLAERHGMTVYNYGINGNSIALPGTEEKHPPMCIRYADMSLRRFFDRMKRTSWYNNTLFVIVADHTNESYHAEYKTELGLFSIPIIFFTPDGSMPAMLRDDCIAQQTDILPTVMGYLGCPKPYVAFGCDLCSTPAAATFAVNYNNGVYQLVKGDYLLQFDGTSTRGVYAFKTDNLLQRNLARQCPEQNEMEKLLKAIIRQYMQRMTQNHLTMKEATSDK